MFVKICGITTEDDALLAVAMGADAVGFVFAPSPRQVTALAVYDIVRRLPPEVLTVGVFRNESPGRVVDIANRSGVKAVQLHGNERPEEAIEIARSIRRVYKAFPAGSPLVQRAREYPSDMVLVDSAQPGSGEVFDWTMVESVPKGLKVILAGGLTPDNVAHAIEVVDPWGVDVSSGVESSPGRKDPRKVRGFITAARAAAPEPYRGSDEMPYDWADE
ncbi:MAG: phosphoribosylanthranilate isomerase [Actinomycetota bacterium]|uniref:phosphoribosylanthranilate isomerase n=1 Tax=freshwater metagenome TaxID=449393 RepID=A0A6J7PIM5_9ZZZZ|nr:phosphoribosylanthranilate isomerase [Actinomycetota bacterium]MSX80622.1 phosphoribosylanthranilate isomerase [Actinomycetota bacterium]